MSPLLAYISETVSGIFCIISSSKLPSIASGIVSSFNFARRNMMISFLVGVMDLVTTLPTRYLLTSPRICGLPVRNIRALGDLWRIWSSESRSFARAAGGYSSRSSMHINVHHEYEISCKNSTISASSSLWPPTTFSQCSQRGSPSVLSQDQDGRQLVVPSRHFLKLPDK